MSRNKEYAMYWGCWVPSRQPSVEAACRKVMDRFEINIRDMEGVSCCPDPVVTERLQREMWLALAARNISIANSMGMELATVCNGCYETFFEAIETLKTDNTLREEVKKVLEKIGKPLPSITSLKHIVEILGQDIGIDQIKNLSANKLSNLNVAVHPGCHLFRAHDREKVQDKPKLLENIVDATGAKRVDYGIQRFCCGYPHRVVEEEFSLKMMLAQKLERMWEESADCIVVSCPACNIQFEFGQLELKRKYKMSFGEGIPVIHVVELVALALGIKPEEFGLHTHRGPTKNIIAKLEK
jgi:heterodisulfide reductase subunit B